MRSDRDWPLYRRMIVLLAALTLVAGCASQPKPAADAWSANDNQDIEEVDEENDPIELFNRFAFSFNLALDTFIFRPAAATYRFLLPVEVRDSVRNALRNLRTPVILANDLFQGELDRAETTLVRFFVNSTVGLLGLFDVAADWGYPYHDEDFGQTLAVHGVGEGFYLVLPIFGPSNPRDGIGILVDTFLDPLTYVAEANDAEEYLFARTAIAGIDLRSRNIEALDDLKRDSIDFYARIRSLYRQKRANEIRNGEAPDDVPMPGLYSFDFDADDDAKPEGESN
ncbi:MAG: VacJ family lipoprotein [Proteobacteria bacterium]|nr:VacJ family lipoprotein [Pseudomonadota bacterium]